MKRRRQLTLEQKQRRREYHQRWYQKNRDVVLARSAEWRKAHPGYVHPITQTDEFKEAARVRARAWSAAFPDRKRATDRAWANANAAKVAEYRRARRAAKRSSGGRGLLPGEWEGVVERSLGICVYCYKPTAALEVEHIEPLSKGGVHDISNVAAACKSCNSSKGNRGLLVWLATRRGRG